MTTMGERKQLQAAVADAAVEWWLGKRPNSYGEVMHIDNPAINTSSSREATLACAVADYVAASRG